MDLISQNVAAKDRVKKLKREDGDEPSFSESSKGLQMGKKKRHGNEEKHLHSQEQMEMRKLENSLFGSLYSPLEFGEGEEKQENIWLKQCSTLFITDRSPHSVLSAYEEEGDFQRVNIDYENETKELKPAWFDDEEDRTTINIAKVNRLRKLRQEEDEVVVSGSAYVSRLRAQHVKLNPRTEWAQLNSKEGGYNSSDDDDTEVFDGILRTNENLVMKSGSKLHPGILEYSKLGEANTEDPSSEEITSVQFHNNAQLLLAGGLDQRVRFFQIDGKRNAEMESIFLEDCPIRKASFLADGSQVIVSGRRNFFYSLDVVKAKVDRFGPLTGREEKSLEMFEISPDSSMIAFVGNEGYILLVSSKTKQLIGTLKMNGTVRSLAFTNCGQQLLSFGGDGQVYHWDLRKRTCFHKGVDEGCINGMAICCSPRGNLFAAGSESGIVNVYNREEFLGSKKKPLKTLDNLTTKVDLMRFNHDAQMLAICSSVKKRSLKLVHIPSFTVFSNWPAGNGTLQYPSCVDFSPNGGFMAVASRSTKSRKSPSKVLFFKLHHYRSA